MVFLHQMAQHWRRGFCQFSKMRFTASSFAAWLEKTSFSTFPGLFPLSYKSYHSNLLIKTFQKFIFLDLLHVLVMWVVMLFGHILCTWINMLGIWIKLNCVYRWMHLRTFNDRLWGLFPSKTLRWLFLNKQIINPWWKRIDKTNTD